MPFYTRTKNLPLKLYKKIRTKSEPSCVPCKVKLSGRKKRITYRISKNVYKIKEYELVIINNKGFYAESFCTFNQNNKLHSLNDNPAAIFYNSKSWYKNGHKSRSNNKPCEISENFTGYKQIINNRSRYHRIGGPAIEYECDKLWYYKGTKIPFKTNIKLLKKKSK